MDEFTQVESETEQLTRQQQTQLSHLGFVLLAQPDLGENLVEQMDARHQIRATYLLDSIERVGNNHTACKIIRLPDSQTKGYGIALHLTHHGSSIIYTDQDSSIEISPGQGNKAPISPHILERIFELLMIGISPHTEATFEDSAFFHYASHS